MRYVNLGCGNRFHPAWLNFDIASGTPEVVAHDLSRGIPLHDASCDVVYHSHLLEHLRRGDGERLVRECYRVLRPGGILRVAVPDLEGICRTYLCKLEAAMGGDVAAAADYDWIMLELFDQAVREQSGGDMIRYLGGTDIPNESFVYERIGEEGRALVKDLRTRASRAVSNTRLPLRRRLGGGVRFMIAAIRDRTAALILGRGAAHAHRIGRFRFAGEVHQWMYDRFSLSRLLERAGFANPVVHTPTSSLIPQWESFQLDTLPDGRVTKPDSLYMEATRPGQGVSAETG